MNKDGIRMAKCHPNKPLLANELCKTCYHRNWARKNRKYKRIPRNEWKKVGRPKITEFALCHPSRLYYAKNLCQNCWAKQYDKLESTPRATCHPTRKHKVGGLCGSCYQREMKKKNPKLKDNASKRQRKNNLRRSFGITIDDYDNLLAKQNGVCKICKQPSNYSDGRRLAVDHDHKTGQIRGLLCGRCNKGLGLFAENPNLLNEAMKYLLKFQENNDEIAA